MNNKKQLEAKLWDECSIEVNLSDYNDLDELTEYVQDNNLYDEEVIYYSNAMEYLKDNDPSLHESIEIASEYGYKIEAINSELLATLLKSRNNGVAFYNLSDEIEEYYNNIEAKNE